MDALAGETIATNSDGSTALNAPVAPVARGVSDAPEAHATDDGARSTEVALKSQGGRLLLRSADGGFYHLKEGGILVSDELSVMCSSEHSWRLRVCTVQTRPQQLSTH